MAYETDKTELGIDLINSPNELLVQSQVKLSRNMQIINDELISKASKLELNLLSSALSQSLKDMSDSLESNMKTLDSNMETLNSKSAATLAEIQNEVNTKATAMAIALS